MALPTLKPYFVTTRPSSASRGTARVQKIAEQTMENEARRRMWSDRNNYLKSSYVVSQKAQEWSSEQSLKSSLEKYKATTASRQQKESKNLDKRRLELKELLDQERDGYQREIKEKMGSLEYKESLKNRAEELRTAREQRRKEVANQKLLDHWKLNCPELREVKSRQQERDTYSKWSDQIFDKRKKKNAELIEEQRYHEKAESERIKELKRQEEEAKRKKREQDELSAQLRKQMDEVRVREEESVLLEQEQALLMKQQRELHEAEQERQRLHNEQKRTEFGRVLLKQAKAQLRRRCRQVQEALELDLKILEEMAKKERQEQLVVTARREKERRDALYMKKVMEEQLALEKQREKELDVLYQEEAAKLWQKREEEWEREKKAREKLMADVMAERQLQIEEKMEQLELLQQETIDQREQLLAEIEKANAIAMEENIAKERMEKYRHDELKDQILQRRKLREEEKVRQELEEEQERLAEEEQDLLIQEEIENITNRPLNHYDPHKRITRELHTPRHSPYAWY